MKKQILTLIITLFIFTLVRAQDTAKGNTPAKAVVKAKTKKVRQVDTAAISALENNLEDLKTITAAITSNIDSCDNLDQIKRYANMIQQIADTLQDHINPIFRDFNTLHPTQYMPIKNIADLTDRMIESSSVVKAKKVNQQIKAEYANLVKAQ